MQATEPLLQELLHDVLQQQSCRSSGQQQRGLERKRGQSRRQSGDQVADVELNGETEAKIAKACEQYEQCLQQLAAVERHLLQAKARALTEEERRLSDMKQALRGYDGLINLPSAGKPCLGSFLDRELLERNYLLHPAHFLPGNSTTLPSPVPCVPLEETPTYLQPTFTSNQHTSTSQPITSTLKPPSTQKPPWRGQLTQAERETERKALARLQQREDYLLCPRHSSQPQPTTSSSGALRRRARETAPGAESESSARNGQLFVAEPNQVVFTDYQVGHTYQVNVGIRNVSGCSRQIRIIPLNSPYFTITRGVGTHPEGLIAPGMHVTCTVTFTPPSLCNYREEIKVQSHSGYCVVIPVLAVRPAPCLSLPEVIDCGSCLAGGRREVELQVENSGGEGRFSLRHTDTHQQSGSVLILGQFTLSPTEFHLPHNHSTTLQVTFTPAVEGRYGEHFAVECDNGDTVSFSFTGSADVLSVGCVSIGDSSSQEISQLTSCGDDKSGQGGVDPVMSAVDYDLRMDRLEDCGVVFDEVNPHCPAHKTIVIRNYSNVDLPFSWKLFRPLTELHSSSGGDPVVDDLVPSLDSPFSVLPSSGTLPAASTHTFLCQFLPHKVGNFLDAAHLVLSRVPLASLDLGREGETWRRLPGADGSGATTVSCVCLLLSAVAQPYELELQPPALLIPSPIPLATDVRRRVKLVSHSVCTLHYCWRELPSEEGITITPTSGSIVAGGGGYGEVVLSRREEGEFSLTLICDIQHSPHPVTLPLHGWTQGPQVSVDCASLQFGLIPLGTSSHLTLTLTSHTNTSLSLHLRQAMRTEVPSGTSGTDRDKITDHDCLHFTPSSPTLPPHSVTTVSVECRPLVTGRLRSTVQCVVDARVIRCVPVRAEVQCPAVVLTECRLHEDTAYVGVGLERRAEMSNTSLIPTHFSWSQQVEGSSGSHCSVSISPLSGRIGPRETLPITVTSTWDSVGSYPEAMLSCDVEGMSEPLLLVLSAEVHGLAVSYSVQEKCLDEELCLDFGSGNSLLTPHVLHLLVTNTTAIPAHLSTTVQSFPPSPTSPPHQHPPHNTLRKKSLLSRTVNIGDRESKTSQQANKDYMCGLLREGRGCCFVVDPPSSTLLPFTTHTLTITAYADMWGDYRDTLKCQVSGLEAVELALHCNITGCPLVFHSTALPQHSLVRFGSHLADAPPVQRVVRINNTGPEEIRVDWQVFNVLQEDSGQLVDCITTIGTPFPRHTPSHSPPHPITAPPPHDSQPSHSGPIPRAAGLIPDSEHGTDGTESGQSRGGMEPSNGGVGVSQSVLESGPVVRVFLRSHEGVRADGPFCVHPVQMVVPARGQSSFTLTFHPAPSARSVDPEAGSSLSAYCLGYISLDQQSAARVWRATGYELAPLRVNLEARLEDPRLHLEEDPDHGLHFSYPASILLQGEHVLSSVSKTHHVTLVNLTSSNLCFTISCSSPHFTITPSPSTPPDIHTLTPHTALSVAIMFRVHQEDMRDCAEDRISFSDVLVVQFSTGATQEFPLSAEIFIPHMSLSTQALELGPCLLGHSLSSSLSLSSTSPVRLPWAVEPAPGLRGVVSVTPSSGVLPPHVGTAGSSSQQHILVTFTPQTECEYTGSVAVREKMTGREMHIAVTASTTSDEVHATNFL